MPRMPRDCWFYYDNIRAIKVDRYAMAKTCRYFQVLLNGPYIEGRKTVINMKLSDMFSYEAFSCVIRYANENYFLADPEKLHIYIEAIQLCVLWNYEDGMDLLSYHLASRLTNRTITDIMGVANRHKYSLGGLIEACEQFERNFPSSFPYNPYNFIVRCTFKGHESRLHHHMNCVKIHLNQEAEEAKSVALWEKTFWDEDLATKWEKPKEESEDDCEAYADLRDKRRFGLRGSEYPEYICYYLKI